MRILVYCTMLRFISSNLRSSLTGGTASPKEVTPEGCTPSSVKAGRRLSGCSQGGRLRASNKASKVYRERVAFAKEALRAYLFVALPKLGDVRSVQV